MENESTLTPVDDSTKHQLAMLVVGTLAGFAANRLAAIGYRMAVEAYRAHHNTEEEN